MEQLRAATGPSERADLLDLHPAHSSSLPWPLPAQHIIRVLIAAALDLPGDLFALASSLPGDTILTSWGGTDGLPHATTTHSEGPWRVVPTRVAWHPGHPCVASCVKKSSRHSCVWRILLSASRTLGVLLCKSSSAKLRTRRCPGCTSVFGIQRHDMPPSLESIHCPPAVGSHTTDGSRPPYALKDPLICFSLSPMFTQRESLSPGPSKLSS